MKVKRFLAYPLALSIMMAALPTAGLAAGPSVQVWVSQVNAADTGMAKGLEPQSSLTFSDDTGARISNLIVVDESNTYQQMDGFGASITEASADLYQNKLTNAQKTEVMNTLFDKETGIGLSMLRQTIGASDHCVAPYNFAPNAQADSLPDFDFSHELETIFPTVQDALSIEPGRVKVVASSWSPPGWMKNNGSELGMYNGVKGTLRTDKYQAYANYLLKFVQNYESRGVDIYAITPTNEPDHASYDWPALPMSHTEAQNLVANYLYPTLRSNGLDTKIICWDHSYTTTNYRDGAYPFEYYANANALARTDGSAWHWYEGDEEVMSVVHKEFPNKDIWFTEGSGGEWGFPKWRTAFLNQSSSVVNIARNWSKSIVYWNLALDENGGPDYYYDVNQHHDSTNRGLITINSTGGWSHNVDYYTLGHVSKFVDPSAYRIDSTSLDGNIETVAFKNPDGSKVLVMTNLLNRGQVMKIKWGNQVLDYTIPAESMVTMKWTGTQSGSAPTPVWFNNLESNTNYVAGTSASVSRGDSTANLGGSTGLKLTTTANGDPGEAAQCAVIRPQSGTTIDASGYQYLLFSVKDMVNPTGCTVKVTFVDQSGKESSAWSHEKTVYENWTRIWVPVAGADGFDRQHISEIRLGFYWRGDYYIDDLSFACGYADGIPSFGNGNLVINGSFEDDGCVAAAPEGWHFEGANPESTYLEKNSSSASGRFHVVHYSAQAHDAYTWQTIYGLENGTYTLRAMVQSGGGQTQNKLLATDFGGAGEKNVTIPVSTPWVRVEITGIQVTNGKCTVAFYTQGNAGDWSCIDNVELIKQ
ncbi:conserved exported hypothetical protein [uncultured Eubacteriales bacterium]|uniref:Glucan endo-1,6-beta-glucosidase n=1 Tax=uncultured Eubacteriales bacterium TaxID=172733 RepID=A0A212K481_9FIRM|nr:conserved exported hypothetical protein [uncultured Eubacteriales bacterium]